ALEPLDGLGLMRRRRARPRTARHDGRPPLPDHALCRGPGNVTHALGITLKQSGVDLLGDSLYLEDRGIPAGPVEWSRRIGLSVGTETPWRCFAAGNACVSGRTLSRR